MIYLAATVLPAPLSPLRNRDEMTTLKTNQSHTCMLRQPPMTYDLSLNRHLFQDDYVSCFIMFEF